jgi:hypothetical protein
MVAAKTALVTDWLCLTRTAGLSFQPNYTSPKTGAVYLLNTQPLGLPAAQQACQDKGAQLVAYSSLAQQAEVRSCAGPARPADRQRKPRRAGDAAAGSMAQAPPAPLQVEANLIASGALLAEWTETYWMGLTASPWPKFSWLDKSVPAPSAAGGLGGMTNPRSLSVCLFMTRPICLHAGTYAHWGVYQPGDSLEPNQLTGNENCGLANYTMGYGGAFGWADAPCESFHASICVVQGGRWSPQIELYCQPGCCVIMQHNARYPPLV